MGKRRDLAVAAAVFLASAALLWWLCGQRLIIVNDEGMYLEGARQMLSGVLPYRDFFALTGPGIYWDVALFFRLFGVTLGAARALLILDLAVVCAGMFWLAAQLGHRLAGAWVACFYLFSLAGDASGIVTVNHRWDSAALSTLAVCLTFQGVRTRRRLLIGLAGAAAAYAAWITPPLLLVAGVALLWVWVNQRWGGAIVFAGATAVVSTAALIALALTHSLVPMIQHLLWTGSQYSSANRFAYGGIIGGYREMFTDTRGAGDFVARIFFVPFLAMPAIVPVVAAILLLVSRRLLRPNLFLVLCALASIAACAPRLDVAHLTYSAPLAYVLAAVAFGELPLARLRPAVVLYLSLGAATLTGVAVLHHPALVRVSSRMGTIFGESADIAFEQDLERSAPPGASFFAFPYVPLAYFITQGANPSPYSYLQPGMMSDTDEAIALNALAQRPPATVLYMNVPPKAWLRVFPSSDRSRLRMTHIEAFLQKNYEQDAAFAQRHRGYQLLHLRPSVLRAASS